MKLVRRDESERVAMPAEHFTGQVELEMVHQAADAEQPDIAHVHFHGGAVSNWHTHPGGQHLLVESGTARVGTETAGEVLLEPGDLVITPAEERHWHGAAHGSDATILAFTWGTTRWDDTAPDVT
jgi:quercetin dioxygenase-like cupin family protein